jgi:hypothetical protein
MPKKSIKRIERMCQFFLWSLNKSKGKNLPLVAWSRLTKLRKHGLGLGIKNMKVQATALIARWLIKLINNKESTWAKLFTTNLKSLACKDNKKVHRLGYSFLDKILFCKPFGFGKLHNTKNIWKAWEEQRKHLLFEMAGNTIPGHWAIENALKVVPATILYSKAQQARIISFLGRIQVEKVQVLWDRRHNR